MLKLIGAAALVLAAMWVFGWIGERWERSRFAGSLDWIVDVLPAPPVVAVLACALAVGVALAWQAL